MRCMRAVLLILVLLAGSLSPPWLRAQEARPPGQPDESRSFYLEQNYPNPVNPDTWIPFQLEERLFDDDGPVTVTIRVYNILNQLVAIPEAVEHPAGRDVLLINLPYIRPGRHLAYWDGRDTAGRPVPSGVYYVQLVVGNQAHTRKLVVLNERRRRNIIPWFGNR